MIKQVTNVNSIGPIGLAWVVLFALKLMAIVDWSWWIVVFFPVVAGLSVTAICFALAALTVGVVWLAARE